MEVKAWCLYWITQLSVDCIFSLWKISCINKKRKNIIMHEVNFEQSSTKKNLSWTRFAKPSWNNVFFVKKNINACNKHYLTSMQVGRCLNLLPVVIAITVNVKLFTIQIEITRKIIEELDDNYIVRSEFFSILKIKK